MILIALKQIHITAPGDPIDVHPNHVAALIAAGLAKYPDPETVAQPIPAPRRRGYRRRDVRAER